MYVISLNKQATNKKGVYVKDALLVISSNEEFLNIQKRINSVNTRVRRRQISIANDITGLLPIIGEGHVVYIRYRSKEMDDWDTEVLTILDNASLRKGKNL